MQVRFTTFTPAALLVAWLLIITGCGRSVHTLPTNVGATGLKILEHNQATRVEGMVQSLLNAETAQVPAIIDQLQEYRLSRTVTMHCNRPPSHCRRACTKSLFFSSFLA